MTTLVGVLVGLVLGLAGVAAWLWRTVRGSYNYAVRGAEHYEREGGVMDPRAIAYSDMASVISLDGNATPKWELGRLARSALRPTSGRST